MGHDNTPPQLPEVIDEAANTPRWVPLLGVILFVLAVAAIVVCHGGVCKDGAATPSDDGARVAP